LFTIPATLRDSLMARLDQNRPVKEVAQIGAVIGREFSYELIGAVAPIPQTQLDDALDQLTNSGLVFRRGTPPDAIYTFKHALVQDAAYDSLLRSRRKLLHKLVAETLEQRFPELVKDQSEVVAHHYTSAGINQKAIPYWLKAGEQAITQFANSEAINHLDKGLNLLVDLPEDDERSRNEIAFQTRKGMALQSARGFSTPEVSETFTRAQELCRQVGDTDYTFAVYLGLWLYYEMRAEYEPAMRIAEEALAKARASQDAAELMVGEGLVGGVALANGDFDRGLRESLAGALLYDHEKHRDLALVYGHNPAATCLDWASWLLWLTGHPDQFLAQNGRVIRLVRESGNPMTSAAVLVHAAAWHSGIGNVETALEFAQETIRLSDEAGIPMRRVEAEIIEGWALAELGEPAPGAAEIENAITNWREMGTVIRLSWWLALLAQARVRAGMKQSALEAIDDALAFVEDRNERCWEAEIHRIKGDILAAINPEDVVSSEACYRKAVDVARSQNARSWELRAATSLARHWREQARSDEGRDLLAPVYNWFTEGFDTKDLKEAKALLGELSA
jgi:predicted ATPase